MGEFKVCQDIIPSPLHTAAIVQVAQETGSLRKTGFCPIP